MKLQHYAHISELVTLQNCHHKDGRKLKPEDLSIVNDASIIFDNDKIIWVGPTKDVPSEYNSIPINNLSGKTVLPEIVDSHTHAVFAGNRSQEYSMRLNGADYQSIAKSGGGILSTVEQTQNCSFEQLYSMAFERLIQIYQKGVGTIEIKSGYGLNFEAEYKLTKVIDKLKRDLFPKIQIFRTFMPAHAVPKNVSSSREYLQKTVFPLLKRVAHEKLIDAVDIFFEQGYFDYDDSVKLFEMANQQQIAIKIHADEFNDNKGAILACQYGALSCDHLLCTQADGIEMLSRSPTVATLLPGTGLFLGKKQANARQMLDQGVKLAIASDFNPGSSHIDDLLLITQLAGPMLKMNSAELICAITHNAAHALGLKMQGAIVKGLTPRFSVFNCNHYSEILYRWGVNQAYRDESLVH